MTWPAIVLWVLIAVATLSRGPMIVYLFSGTAVFGSLTMLPSEFAGGLNVPAQTICAAILVLKILCQRGHFDAVMRLAFDIRTLGMLTIFWVYAILSAIIYPRFFEGQIQLFPINNINGGLNPLHPTSANLTQSIYLSISISILYVFAVAGRHEEFRRHFLQSVLLAGGLFVATGIADLTFSSSGLSDLLTPFRNADYALLTDVTVGDQKRVVGLMSEASAYGGAVTVLAGFLYFCRDCFDLALRAHIVPVLTLTLAIMAFLSTSSTAYVGLGIIGAMIVAQACYEVFIGKSNSGLKSRAFLLLGFSFILIFGVLEVVPASISAPYFNLFDVMIFQKSDTISYIERSSWTQAGLDAFWATHGIGVGIGSLRTSNWYVNILASTGAFGVLCLLMFFFRVLISRVDRLSGQLILLSTGLRLTLLPFAVMIALAGTTPDPGVQIMAILGILSALWFEARQFDFSRKGTSLAAKIDFNLVSNR